MEIYIVPRITGCFAIFKKNIYIFSIFFLKIFEILEHNGIIQLFISIEKAIRFLIIYLLFYNDDLIVQKKENEKLYIIRKIRSKCDIIISKNMSFNLIFNYILFGTN